MSSYWQWQKNHCVKSVRLRSFFWSVFSRTRAEYGDLQRMLAQKVEWISKFSFENIFRWVSKMNLLSWLNFMIMMAVSHSFGTWLKFLKKYLKCMLEKHVIMNLIIMHIGTHQRRIQMECFAKLVNGSKLLTVPAKCSLLDVWQCCEYASAHAITQYSNEILAV